MTFLGSVGAESAVDSTVAGFVGAAADVEVEARGILFT